MWEGGGTKFWEFGIIFFAQLVAYVLQLALTISPYAAIHGFLVHSYTSKSRLDY